MKILFVCFYSFLGTNKAHPRVTQESVKTTRMFWLQWSALYIDILTGVTGNRTLYLNQLQMHPDEQVATLGRAPLGFISCRVSYLGNPPPPERGKCRSVCRCVYELDGDVELLCYAVAELRCAGKVGLEACFG